MPIAAVDLHIVHVSARTNWTFVCVRTDDGLTGVGEASLNGYEPLLAAYLDLLRPRLIGASPDDNLPAVATYAHAQAGLVANAVRSALRQAFVDLRAKALGVPAFHVLGGKRRDTVPVYANINRMTVDRSPAGCAASACKAVEQGFSAIKIAPFDGVLPGEPSSAPAIEAGIERVRAIREAIGPGIRLMVDCHWRFDEPTALRVLDRLASLGIAWFECPISENPNAHDALGRLREAAQQRGVMLAACELQPCPDAFRPFVERRRVDAIMPDVKYCGGPIAMLEIARHAHEHGVAFSPHNPTGPVCTMASLHAALAAVDVASLELQVGETPLTRELVGGVEPPFANSAFGVPDRPGFGIDLDEAVLRAHPYAPVKPGLDERLG